MNIAHISTFPPTRCGIATFAQDLIDNLTGVRSYRFRLCYGQDYADGFEYHATNSEHSEFAELGAAVNASAAAVVDLQHEFGIWGGVEGEYLIPFLQHCEVPIVATLHTPLGRSQRQKEMIALLCEKSAKVVVLTESGRNAIVSLVPHCRDRITVIRHGIPDIPLTFPGNERGTDESVKFISPGFFRPDKGLEIILDAFETLKELNIRFHYKIVGSPQPQFDGQRQYYDWVMGIVRRKGIERNVEVRAAFLSRPDLIEQIQLAECGIIGYTDLTHSSSGIVPLILACSRPVISTPIVYSRELATKTPGIFLTSGVSSKAISDALRYVIAHRQDMKALLPKIYHCGQQWVWRQAAEQYLHVFRETCV